eukprot:TRINITY_DN20744_c0_g6_i1.p1 TRINITY_DN20744_c0_g6~~TRINITY_DN20744_c0_g6_i1.p1  ORF type:complete len:833 (+),score=248.08 TRINITY_DN20744_c0_g6_i1:98-2500(+)
MGCGGSVDGAKNNDKAAGTSPPSKDERGTAKLENQDFTQTMEFLSKVNLFRLLPKDEHPLLAAACLTVNIKQGSTIIQQGESGAEFFIIKKGDASVSVRDDDGTTRKVAMLKEGDYFGESALLRDVPRTATIAAESDIIALKVTRAKFAELGLNDKLQFPNRKAVGAGGGQDLKFGSKPPSPKTDAEKELIADALAKNENLQTMVSLDQERIDAMIEVAWKEEVSAGTNIITAGDLEADYFYVVQEGSFEVTVVENPFGGDDSKGQSVERAMLKGEVKHTQSLGKGTSFGELALLYFVPRAATVCAKIDSVVWVFDRKNFKSILMKQSAKKIEEYITYLNRVELLASLLVEEKKAVAQALVEMHFSKGDMVITQGEPGSTFYILFEGEVTVIKDGVEQSKLSASEGRGEAKTFGERALLNGEPRAATMMVSSQTAKALALHRDSFNLLLGPLEDIIKRGATGASNVKQMVMNPHDKPREKILRKDLQRIGLLGCGGFGAVELYEHKTTKETYAMKCLSKGYIVKCGMQESVMNEKNILMMTNSPFIIRLWETYSGVQSLYFLLELALGGELYATYNRKGLHGSEKHAKFYVAGVICGFEHLHHRHIIYRDLKPENLLLSDKGKLMIADMGLAKFVIGKTYSTCGTPDYFAPELIASKGHTNAVDWWTLGILIFELMSGSPPFESAYPMQTYAKVMKGITKVHFPAKCQGPVGSLIKALLQEEPCERLPMKPSGLKKLREHEWYTDFNWQHFMDLVMEPPYHPVVKSKKDIANFRACKEDMPRQIDYKDDGSGWDANFATA